MEDPYYQKLPFTLGEDQLNYDFVIFGTNLQACLLAAHLAKIQKKTGLVLEFEKGYGADIKTMSLKQLHQFMQTKGLSSQTNAPLPFESVLPQSLMLSNNQYINKKKQTSKSLRGYNIDLQPRVFSGSSFACEMLKDGNMDQYMDFRVIKKVLFLLNGKLEEVPLNLKTIMNASGLSLFQRKDLFKGVHQLVKIYYKFHSVQVDNNSTNQFDKDTDVNQQLYSLFCEQKDKLCHKFLLKALNNKQKLFDMVMYGICGYQYKKPPQFVQKQYSSLQMLKRFGRFVKSCGVYSQTPYLYVDNGIGDIPQAFSRIASIFGSIFIVHPRVEIDQIENKGQLGYQIVSNLSPNEKIKTKTIQFTDPYFNYIAPKLQSQGQPHFEKVLRVIIINKTPADFKHTGPQIIHSFQNTNFINPVTCFLFDSGSSNCPQDQNVLQFFTIIESSQPQFVQSQVQAIIKLSVNIFGQQQTQYVAAYIQTNTYFNKPGKHIIQNDWNFDLQRVFEHFKQMIGQQTKYFKDESIPNSNNADEQDGYYEGLLSKLQNLKQKKEQKQKEVVNQQQLKQQVKEVQKVNQQQKNEQTIDQPIVTIESQQPKTQETQSPKITEQIKTQENSLSSDKVNTQNSDVINTQSQ